MSVRPNYILNRARLAGASLFLMFLIVPDFLPNFIPTQNSVSSLTKYDHESEVLRGKFSSVLEDASKAFVFCKDASGKTTKKSNFHSLLSFD